MPNAVSVALLGNQRYSTAGLYDRDAQGVETMVPLEVVRPESTADIGAIVKDLSSRKMAVTPRCGGTGLAGGSVPSQKGAALLTGHLRRILEFDPKQGILTAEPGATPKQINQYIDADGWMLPCAMDTGGVAGVAGCLSTRARPYTQGKGPYLYDLATSMIGVDGNGEYQALPPQQFVGAEGTLGIITQITFKLIRKPESTAVVSAECPLPDALNALPWLRRCVSLLSVEWYEGSRLTLRFSGDSWRVDSAIAAAPLKVVRKADAPPSFLTQIPHGAHWLLISSALPLSKQERGADISQRLCHDLGLGCYRFLQLLDGRIQILLSLAGERRSFLEKTERFLLAWTNALDGLGGAVAGSHGIGTVYQRFLPPFFREGDIALLQQHKRKYDPEGIFSPGHLFPVSGRCVERSV